MLTAGQATTKYIEPTKRLLRLSNNMAQIPEDMMQMVYVQLVGKLKNRSKWRHLKRIVETDAFRYDAYFRQYGKESDREAIYGFFTMTDQYIFVPSKLNAKALVICYITEKAMKAYNQNEDWGLLRLPCS